MFYEIDVNEVIEKTNGEFLLNVRGLYGADRFDSVKAVEIIKAATADGLIESIETADDQTVYKFKEGNDLGALFTKRQRRLIETTFAYVQSTFTPRRKAHSRVTGRYKSQK